MDRRGSTTTKIAWNDPYFHTAMWTTAKYVFFAVSVETLLGLGLALLVSRQLKFAGTIRVGLILPMTIAPVVVGVMWRLIYDSSVGVVDPFFTLFGFNPPEVLANYTSAFIAVVVVDIWEWTPLMFLIILAGLQSLPEEPLEAARVDGAGRLRIFFDHTLPMLVPVLLVAIVLRTIDAVGTFDQIYVLTGGGPGTATRLISIYAYNTAFLFTQYGVASGDADRASGDGCHPDGGRCPTDEEDGVLRQRLPRIGLYFAIAVVLVIALFPFWWMINTSLKQPVDIFGGVTLYPHHPTIDNYTRLFNTYHFGAYLAEQPDHRRPSRSRSAWCWARSRPIRWRDSDLRVRAQPVGAGGRRCSCGCCRPILLVIPLYIMLGKWGLLNTRLGLILIYSCLNTSFVIWMMQSFLARDPAATSRRPRWWTATRG